MADLRGWVFAGVLLGGTFAVIAIDKYVIRKNVLPPGGREPAALNLLVTALLLNILALPTYFGETRGTKKARWVGFAMFLLCFAVAVGAFTVVMLADGPR